MKFPVILADEENILSANSLEESATEGNEDGVPLPLTNWKEKIFLLINVATKNNTPDCKWWLFPGVEFIRNDYFNTWTCIMNIYYFYN